MRRPYVPSPCIDVCRIHPVTGWCEGCYRTLDEISRWTRYTEAERDTVMKSLAQRRATPKRGP